MVGFTGKNNSPRNGFYLSNPSVMYYCVNGGVYKNAQHISHQGIPCKHGDTIRAVFDAEKLEVQFYINSKQAGSPLKTTIKK